MSISKVAEKLYEELQSKFGVGFYAVGHNEKDTVFVYEHKRGLKKHRLRPDWFPVDLNLEFKYIGKIKAI